MNQFQKLTQTMSAQDSYVAYRQSFGNSPFPRIPFLNVCYLLFSLHNKHASHTIARKISCIWQRSRELIAKRVKPTPHNTTANQAAVGECCVRVWRCSFWLSRCIVFSRDTDDMVYYVPLRRLSQSLEQLQQCQTTAYMFTPHSQLQAILPHVVGLTRAQQVDASLKIQPATDGGTLCVLKIKQKKKSLHSEFLFF